MTKDSAGQIATKKQSEPKKPTLRAAMTTFAMSVAACLIVAAVAVTWVKIIDLEGRVKALDAHVLQLELSSSKDLEKLRLDLNRSRTDAAQEKMYRSELDDQNAKVNAVIIDGINQARQKVKLNPVDIEGSARYGEIAPCTNCK